MSLENIDRISKEVQELLVENKCTISEIATILYSVIFEFFEQPVQKAHLEKINIKLLESKDIDDLLDKIFFLQKELIKQELFNKENK